MIPHPHAAGLVATLDPAWRRKVWLGGLVLCVPIVGWPAVLGYRARFVHHLRTDTAAALPSWGEGFWGFVGEGLRAMAVIFGHLAPLYATVALLVGSRGFVPDATAGWLALGFVCLPIFSTLSFPTACVLLATAEPAWLGPGECAACLAAFAVLVFVIPAGFLQVSLTGRHRSAFALWRTLPFVARHFGAYLRAWWYSGLMSLCGHLALPLAPWGVVWCYLAILALFNELLLAGAPGPAPGWLPRALGTPTLAGRGGSGLRRIQDAAGETVLVADLLGFSAPLPRWPRR